MHFGNEHGILAFVSDGDDHSLSQSNKWIFVYLKSTGTDFVGWNKSYLDLVS